MAEDIERILAEEAEAAEEHRDDDVPMVRSRRPAQEPSQVYSLRIPVERLEELRQLAAARHLTPSALMRSWVLERLELESFGGDGFIAAVRRAVHEELQEHWSPTPPRKTSATRTRKPAAQPKIRQATKTSARAAAIRKPTS
jgi:hypothetical protein